MGNGASNPVGGMAAVVAADALAIYLQDWGVPAKYWPAGTLNAGVEAEAGTDVTVYVGGLMGGGGSHRFAAPQTRGGGGMNSQQSRDGYGLVCAALEPGASESGAVGGVKGGAVVKLLKGDTFEVPGWVVGLAAETARVMVAGDVERPGGGMWTCRVGV
ncbi:MAG: hypothetical protein ACREJO_18010 [Phycisphaerales bacterium]